MRNEISTMPQVVIVFDVSGRVEPQQHKIDYL